MVNNHPDRASYENIWDRLIDKEIKNYMKVYPSCIQLVPDAKEEIWMKYVSLNYHCKSTYMKSPEGKIDRHKVAACYLIAISSVKPMRFVKSIERNDKFVYFALNEKLAITVALSLLRAFVESIIVENSGLSDEERDKLIKKFQNGIAVPTGALVNHGEYIDNFASEIYFAVAEGNISILSIAHELYLLEVLTRIKNDNV